MRVHVQFHPDRLTSGGETVMAAIVRDGRYRSQFETGTSNGGLTAHPGGDRWRWESRLFAGRYDDGPANRRPVYGALAVDPAADASGYGAAPRFGSAHLVLREEVLARATACFPDSVFEPERVVAADDSTAVEELVGKCAASGHDVLDAYVEAHVHGGLPLRDVEAVVLDPCFAGSVVEEAASGTRCEVRWHRGFRLAPAGLDAAGRAQAAAYRTPEAWHLAVGLAAGASDGLLTPLRLSAAAAAGEHDPQSLKHVWHLLARFGRA